MTEVGVQLGHLSSYPQKRPSVSRQQGDSSTGLATMLKAQAKSDATVPTEKNTRIGVMIVERHPAVRRALMQRLSVQPQLDIVDAVATLDQLPGRSTESSYRANDRRVDILLLGLQNGTDDELLATLASVRKLSSLRLKVVVLAPYADEVERALLQEAGVDHYLLKQIDSSFLIEEIEAAAGTTSTPTAD